MANATPIERASPARTFDLLNFYRFVGAVGVALAHYTAYFPLGREFRAPLFEELHPLMGFFFTLSGFVIMHVYDGRISSLRKYGDYLRKRLARIYPIFFVTFLISYAFAVYTKNHSEMFAPSAILPNLLLVHAWFTTKMLTFDYPSWSVSAEMFVYLLFPVFLLLIDRMRKFAVALPFLLGAAIAGFYALFDLGDWIAATYNGGCLLATPCFVAGMIVHRLLAGRLAGFRAPVWLAHVLAFATIALVLARAPVLLLLVYMPVLVFVMAAAEPDRPGVLSRPLARDLANASYSFYLLHIPVADVVLRSLVHRLGWPPTATYALAPVALIVTAVLSVVSFRYFEEPARRFIGAPLRRIPAPASVLSPRKQPVGDAP